MILVSLDLSKTIQQISLAIRLKYSEQWMNEM
jgi:hypothetical protein